MAEPKKKKKKVTSDETSERKIDRKVWDQLDSAASNVTHRQAMLEQFAAQNAEVIGTFRRLEYDYTKAVEAAKDIYSTHRDVAGQRWEGFKASGTKTVDAYALYEKLEDAAEPYLETKLSVRRDVYDAAVAEGIIPAEVAKAVEGTQWRIYSPQLRGLPLDTRDGE